MLTLKLRPHDILERSRARVPVGILLARLMIVFAMICTVATVVMLAG